VIKLIRPFAPKAIRETSNALRRDVNSKIKKHNGFDKIPKEEKNSFWNKFKRCEGIDLIKAMSHKKCAYCESAIELSSYIELDHFFPQSLFPSSAYSWKNLLPCCSRCNKAKSNLNTKLYPIINPAKYDPIDYIRYQGTYPVPRQDIHHSKWIIAFRTIQILNLDRSVILRSRQPLYRAFIELEISIKEKLEEREVANGTQNITKIDEAILSSLETIESMSSYDNQFTGWITSIINESEIVLKAKQTVAK